MDLMLVVCFDIEVIITVVTTRVFAKQAPYTSVLVNTHIEKISAAKTNLTSHCSLTSADFCTIVANSIDICAQFEGHCVIGLQQISV
jgi:hypothetical protein